MTHETTLVSYPKSGRTWLKVLLGKYFADAAGAPPEEVADLDRLTARLGLPALTQTHDGSGVYGRRSSRELQADKSEYGSHDVLLLTRGVPDTLVSSYFQATRRRNVFDGGMKSFVRSERFGARKLITFLEQWHAARETPHRLLHVTYESLHADTRAVLAEVLEFLGVARVEPVHLESAIEFARFENMRRMESQDALGRSWLRPRDATDQDSFKTRRGKVGGYRDYLTPEDIAFVEAEVTKSRCPWVRMA